jgi:hypothetical protein
LKGRVLLTVEDVMVDIASRRAVVCAALLLLVPASLSAADDFETALLRKFTKQNQSSVIQLKLQVEKNLTKAILLGQAEPEKAYLLLRETQFLLDEADTLSRAERDVLMRKLDDGCRDAKARLDSKRQQSKPRPTEEAAGPVLLGPIIGTYQSQSQATVTPIVSPDRRWVRISFSGSFFFRSR